MFVLEWVNGQDLGYLLSRCQIGLLPYKNSKDFSYTFSNKFPEYLSYGLVCACGVDGEMAKLVKKYNCGFSYDSLDEEDLGRKLLGLLNEEILMQRYYENAVNLHEKMFNSDIIFNRYADYLECISECRNI